MVSALKGSQVLHNICAKVLFSHDRGFHEAVFIVRYEKMKGRELQRSIGLGTEHSTQFRVVPHSLRTCALWNRAGGRVGEWDSTASRKTDRWMREVVMRVVAIPTESCQRRHK